MKKIKIQLPAVREVNIQGRHFYTCIVPNTNKKQVYGHSIDELREQYEETLPKGLMQIYEDSPFEYLYKNGILLLDSFNASNNFSIVLANNIHCIQSIKDIPIYQLNDRILNEWIRSLYTLNSQGTVKYYLDIVERVFKKYDLPITLKPLGKEEAQALNSEHIYCVHNIETPAFREFLLECKKPCQIALYLYLVLKEIDNNAEIRIDDIVSIKVKDIQYGLCVAGVEIPKESIDILTLFAQWEKKNADGFLFTRTTGLQITTSEVIRTMRNALLICGLPTNVWIEEHPDVKLRRNRAYNAQLSSFKNYVKTLDITNEQKDRLLQYFLDCQQSDRKED